MIPWFNVTSFSGVNEQFCSHPWRNIGGSYKPQPGLLSGRSASCEVTFSHFGLASPQYQDSSQDYPQYTGQRKRHHR